MEYLKIDDFKKYNFLSSLKFSPNGKNEAVIVKKANDENGYFSSIFIKKEEKFYPLTNENGSISSFIWLDDENILFPEIRDKKIKEKKEKGEKISSFYKININGGEAKLAFNIEAEVLNIDLMPNGDFLVSAVHDNNSTDEKEKDYEIIEELPFWSNGEGFIYKKRKVLYTYNPEHGLTPLTSSLGDVTDYKISKKGIIAFTGVLDVPPVRDIKECLYIIDSGKIEKVLEEPMFIEAFDFWNDEIFLAASKGEKYFYHEDPTFYLLNIKNKNLKKLVKYDRSIGSSINTDCSFGSGFTYKVFEDAFYFISIDGYYSDIYKLDLKSCEIKNITNSKGSVQFFDICSKGISAVGFINGKLQEIYSLKNGELDLETHFNEEIFNSIKHPKIEHHVIRDHEGVDFDGFVMFPVDYDETKKYPAILDIHGGPRTTFGEVYFHEMKYWASKNYFVLFCNPRGSDGKGNEFSQIAGKYGTIDYDNIMEFVDEMIKKYPALDSERMGVTGGSYGGFMTNWIIGHTDRFKAAATQRSISNWTSFYMSDIGYYFGPYEQNASIWDNPEKLWWHSPLKYINKAKTPTLIIHSDEDYRCPVPEAYQLFAALKFHGVESKLVVFHGENHELSRSGKPDHRLKRLTEITDWMDKYL